MQQVTVEKQSRNQVSLLCNGSFSHTQKPHGQVQNLWNKRTGNGLNRCQQRHQHQHQYQPPHPLPHQQVRVSRSSHRLVGGIGFICLNLLCKSSAIGFICLKQLAGWCHQLHLPLPSRSKWWYRLHLPQPPLQVRRYWLHLPPATGRVVSSASSASTVETFRMHAKRTVNQDRTCSRLGQRSPGPASVSASASASTSTSASTTSGQNGTEWRIVQNGTSKGELLERGAD